MREPANVITFDCNLLPSDCPGIFFARHWRQALGRFETRGPVSGYSEDGIGDRRGNWMTQTKSVAD